MQHGADRSLVYWRYFQISLFPWSWRPHSVYCMWGYPARGRRRDSLSNAVLSRRSRIESSSSPAFSWWQEPYDARLIAVVLGFDTILPSKKHGEIFLDEDYIEVEDIRTINIQQAERRVTIETDVLMREPPKGMLKAAIVDGRYASSSSRMYETL